MTSDPRVLGVILLDAEHSVETLGWDDPFSWQPPPGLGEGFYGHPAAWPLPVVFAVAEGATGKASAEGTPAAVQGVVDAIARLDGRCDLIDISDRAGMPFALVRRAADVLLEHRLLVPAGDEGR